MPKPHHAPDSRAGRILWLLEELHLPFELNRLDVHPKVLAAANDALAGRDRMIGDLSGVDVILGHACCMARRIGCIHGEMAHLHAHVTRPEARPAFAKGIRA